MNPQTLPYILFAALLIAAVVIARLLILRRRDAAAKGEANARCWTANDEARRERWNAAAYRSALQFYATDANWHGADSKKHSTVFKDRGRTAREALVKEAA